jgi:hypothetical protein
MKSHLTLRLPPELARALARHARTRGVPKSAIVREAVAQYLGPAAPPAGRPAGVTGRELAERWRTMPHLTAREADEFAADIAAARDALPPVVTEWE